MNDKKIVLAISGSLRKPSFTEKMLDLCIEGMGENVEVRKFYPHKMKIGPCTSCWSCWGKKNPGVCAQKDDFQEILEIYKQADYFLLAAPLYLFSFPATVKNVLDRFFVILEPAQVESPRGGTEHPKRFDSHPKTVLISSCGFPEIENFDFLKQYFHKICSEFGWSWSGEILIPASGVAHAPKLFDKKYELIKKAGAELVGGCISKETMDGIAAPVMSAEDYRTMANASFSGGIMGKIKTVSIALKAMHEAGKKS
ncbi:MAG: flavodoxin family protein [Candidatus Methanoperedens sp.]|nr:flavodoxin family protein [Candidatus Methanoperedens sp.]MCZ7395584.1 flavodoxin family protein [Candidatus Methanoperedens sp.]